MRYINGFLVTEGFALDDVHYNGVAKYVAWPLSGQTDSESISLAKQQLTYWLDQPDSDLILIDNHDFVEKYVNHAKKIGLPFKIFWLTSEYDGTSQYQNSSRNYSLAFLGWDYLASVDASYLYDDGDFLFAMFDKELRCVKERITAKGLFATKEDAKLYAALRKEVDPKKNQLEFTDEEYFVATFCVQT